MTASEKRHRRWTITACFLGSLTFGSGICGAYRQANAQTPPAKSDLPELLPLPLPVPPTLTPIENPRPVAPPPRIAQPAQPLPMAQPILPPPLPQPDFRLQPFEPRHNVKSPEPLPPMGQIPVPTLTSFAPSRPPQEEPPMPLSLRRTAFSALVGTALVTGSMYADNDPPKATDTSISKKDIDTTNKLLADLKTQLAELKTKDFAELKKEIAELKSKDIADLRKELDTLKTFRKQMLDTIEGTTDQGANGNGLVKKINSLDDKLSALTKQLDSLDKKLETTRTALSSPVAKEPEKEKAKTGSVKLVNMYATDVDILVNGKGYRVAPNESKSVVLAPGSFTYQLLTSGGAEKTRTLKEGEEVTLLVN